MTNGSAAAAIRRVIVEQAGGYLVNVERVPAETCSVCAAPVDGYAECIRCRDAVAHFGAEVADLVGAVTYARDGHQTGTVMYGYKASPRQDQHFQIVQLLLADALLNHRECAERIVGKGPISGWATVPSLTKARADHPLPRMVGPWLPHLDQIQLAAVPSPSSPRSVRPENFVSPAISGHVLLVDDAWVSGSQVQSAAITLKRSGADAVTVLVVARWLDRNWPPTARWMLARRGQRPDFDPTRCPFTAALCSPHFF